MAEKETYREKADAQLRELEARIDVLEAKAMQTKAEGKLGYQRTMEDLRAQQERISRRLDEAWGASEEAWHDLKKGIDSSLEDLQASVDRVVDEIR